MLSCLWLGVKAQSPTYINETFNINAGVPVVWYGDVTFGPNAVVYLEDGASATFYGKNMLVNPNAKFIALPGNNQTGTGNIVFKGSNPLYTNYPLQQTLNGGFATSSNPSFINIEIDNSEGLALLGHTHVSNTVKFTTGHIFLNNFNLVLSSNANLASFNVNKHIVTNGTGVLSKEGLVNNANFLFPISIAGADYTPATVKNTATAARTINVQVKDYTASAANETTFANKGMDRTWQITANTAGTADIVLQHNAENNTNGTGTNQTNFDNTKAYIAQQITAGVWSQLCTVADGGSPISMHTGVGFTLPTSVNATAFFTKNTLSCTDLRVTKTVNNATPFVTNNLVFTIEAKNLSTINATGVKVTDVLPAGFTFVSSTVTVGAYNSTTGVWDIGNLAAGASQTLTITARVNATGSYANTASITGNETDPDLSNNSSTSTPTPGVFQANLSVTKQVDNMSPIVGNEVTFTIAVANAGPNNATGVNVTDLLPSGYTFVSATPSVGSYNSTTGIWTIGNFANGASANLVVKAIVKATGDYRNVATIAGAELDPATTNNTASVTPVPNAALVNLSITKTAPAKPVAIGDNFEYTIEVKNIGAQLASQVVATDILPTGISFVSVNTTHGTAAYGSNRTISWNIGSLAVGATVTLSLKVRADVPGIVVNTATVTSLQTDTQPADNSATFSKEILNLTLPNVITPNGDGRNDTFKILGLNNYSENSLAIYNRWNNEVWRSRGGSYRDEWSGEGLSEGTYFYVLKLKDKTGQWQVVTGWVLLLRN